MVPNTNLGGASSYRPATLKAIQDNREAIDNIKTAIQHEDDYSFMRHNDVRILRFVHSAIPTAWDVVGLLKDRCPFKRLNSIGCRLLKSDLRSNSTTSDN